MKTSKGFVRFAFALAGLMLSPILVAAQRGDNVVIGTGNALAASPAWIDASAFCLSNGNGGTTHCSNGQTSEYDVCAMINQALSPALNAGGGVIDARGVVPSGANPQQLCDSNHSNPFGSPLSATNTKPITVLLPASTIGLTAPWVLPSNVHLVGMGTQTVLSPNPGSDFGSSAMIVMGSQDCFPCSGISIEHLQLFGNNTGSYGGIDNQYAQASSYVNDVGISNLVGTGLTIGPGAANSGPYTNISFSAHTTKADQCSPPLNAPSCVNLQAQTEGLHGITCVGDISTTGNPNTPVAAILVNASNNSIEDVHVESYWDGIRVGDISQTATISNIDVSNVFTSASNTCRHNAQYVTNAVHICGSHTTNSSVFGQCSNTSTVVNDVTILGATNYLNVSTDNPNPVATSVRDDQSGTTIQGCALTTSGCPAVINSGMYALGESSSGGFTRLASIPASSLYGPYTSVVATWGSGTTSISSTPCSTPGVLYSKTDSVTDKSVYVCTFSNTWQAIP